MAENCPNLEFCPDLEFCPGLEFRMKRALTIATLLLTIAASASAQTKGRVSVGGSVTFVQPTDSEVGSLVGIGPLVRLNPRKGWGVAGGLSWFRADVDNPTTGDPFAKLRVRPVMGGVSYTLGEQPVLVSFSIVAGPSFNDFDFDEDFLDTLPAGLRPDLDIKNSFVVRPGVGVTWTVAERVAITGFAGYSYNRPDIVYRDVAGQEYRNPWKADAILLSVGAVYSLF
jgi:Outer membrane protein beta-barrel domain